LVRDGAGLTLHEVGYGYKDWFEHPVPLKYSRRLHDLDAKKSCRIVSSLCSLFKFWLNSGVPKTAGNHRMHDERRS
jgi:hypothetical protein